jgi:hypothetical protein
MPSTRINSSARSSSIAPGACTSCPAALFLHWLLLALSITQECTKPTRMLSTPSVLNRSPVRCAQAHTCAEMKMGRYCADTLLHSLNLCPPRPISHLRQTSPYFSGRARCSPTRQSLPLLHRSKSRACVHAFVCAAYTCSAVCICAATVLYVCVLCLCVCAVLAVCVYVCAVCVFACAVCV